MNVGKEFRGKVTKRFYDLPEDQDDELVNALFQKYELLESFDDLSLKLLLVITKGNATEIAQCIERLDGNYVVCQDLAEARRVTRKIRVTPSFVFAVMNPGESSTCFIDEMMEFRSLYPDIPVLWMSPDFQRDELDPGKPRNYEAAMRLPLTDDRLKLALCAATWNQRARFVTA